MKKTLKELRTERGLTQEEVAKALFVTRTTYTRWELGLQPIKESNRLLIAMFYHRSIDEIQWED